MTVWPAAEFQPGDTRLSKIGSDWLDANDVWKGTILATWGRPKEQPKAEPKEPQKLEPKEQQKPETKKVPTIEDLKNDPLIQWINPKPEIRLEGRVREVVFSNGDRLKLGGPEGWVLTDKNGKKVTIGEDLTKGRSTLHEYRLSNGATYYSGCFNSGISYPNGDGFSFTFYTMRGGKVVA